MAEYQLPDGSTTNSIPVELVICRKRDMKSLFNNIAYLKNFVAPTQVKSFKQENPDSNSLMVLAETEEAANHIIDNQVGEIIQKIGMDNIHEIHITDQKGYNNL